MNESEQCFTLSKVLVSGLKVGLRDAPEPLQCHYNYWGLDVLRMRVPRVLNTVKAENIVIINVANCSRKPTVMAGREIPACDA